MEDNSKGPLRYVKSYYSDPNIIKSYRDAYLWPSEEKIVRRVFDVGSSILDIGCGAGRTSIALAKMGYRVTGIDIIPGMIEAAKCQAGEHGVNVEFEVMDAVEMTFAAESFQNAFFSFNGFEQIPVKGNREKVLKDTFRILEPGGCFILTARSGLALGRRSIGWVWMSVKCPFLKLLSQNAEKWEFGDKLWRGEYHHYLSPFYIRSFSKKVGFKLLYFNSDKNIVREKNSNFLTNFSNDKTLFYVFKKNPV